MDEVVFTRKELHDLVWSVPMLTLAKKYEISDTGLRKICTRMGVPLPKAGHWEKIRAGKKVQRFALSTKYEGENEVKLTIRKEGDIGGNPVRLHEEQLKSDPTINFIVPDKLSSQDKRIISARESLNENRRHTDKGLARTNQGQLDIKVAPVNISRALRFMDTLIKVVEKRGLKVETQNHTYVTVDDQRMKILLREKLKKGETLTHWGTPDYIPSGKFYFKLDDYPGKEWIDGPKTIEEQLPNIIARLEIQAKELLASQLEWKRIRDIQKEKDRIAQELKDRKEQDLANFKQMLTASKRWHKATNLRHYINSFEQNALENNNMTDELRSWLDWARQKADWYDPFTEKEDELLSEVDREELTFTKR